MTNPLLETIKDNYLVRQILDTLADGVFILDTRGRIVSWSRAMEKISGFTSAQALGQPCRLLNFSNCLGISGSGDSKNCALLQGEATGAMECYLRHRSGYDIPVIKNATAVRNENNRIIGIVEAITDITELEKARNKVREASRRLGEMHGLEKIIGKGPAMQSLFSMIKAVSASQATVLVQGESGTGKELVAGAIHYNSSRGDKPFVIVNCSALSESLLESELFGHAKGAFTGAVANRTGRLEEAHTGTIFLDEIGELSPLVQTKLLRVLQEKEIERIGESRKRKLDIRIITATHRDLHQLVREGRFREDLYYRLKVFTVQVPALRERKSDIHLLISHFMDQQNKRTDKRVHKIAPAAMKHLTDYGWPGNVRELEHAIEHAFVLCEAGTILPGHLPLEIRHPQRTSPSPLRTAPGTKPPLTRAALLDWLHHCQWNKAETARQLGVSRTTVWKYMKTWHIPFDPPRDTHPQPCPRG